MPMSKCKWLSVLPPHVFSAHSNGTAPRSFVISPEIYGQLADPSSPLVFDDDPIILTFTVQLVYYACTINLSS